MPIFDTHAHYDDEAFDEDRFEMLESMQENGIGHIVDVCASVGHFDRVYDLVEKYPFVYGAVGVHPDDADKVDVAVLNEIRRYCDMEKTVAVGEIGLDYYWHKEKEEHLLQQKVFRQQMDIAREKKLPFMIHSRDAAEDTLNIVKEYMKDGMYGGIIHCFSYSKEIAREYLNMGLYLGIGGVCGFFVGIFMTFGVKNGMSDLSDLVRPLALPIIAVIFVVSIVLMEFYSRKLKDTMKHLEEAEDEQYEVLSYEEEKYGAMLMNCNVILQVCDIIVLTFTFSRSWLEEASGKELAGFLAACVLFCINFFLYGYYQMRYVKMVQAAHPEKRGDMNSKNFQKDWMASCDEAEKEMVYQSAYKAYTALGKMLQILLCATMLLHLVFHTGILAVIVVGVIYLTMTLTYHRSCVSLQKAKLNL